MNRDRGTGLVLVGYRGTGKTTVGQLLAGRLGLAFADSDRVIESAAGRPVAALFADEGEPAFRDREAAAIEQLAAGADLVLATGGGAILRGSNRAALRRFGFVAWLTADPAVLEGRLRAEAASRPALTAAGTLGEIAQVLAARTPLYREVADVAIATDGRAVDQVADDVAGAYRRWQSEGE